jgi:hypothetical protein
MNIEFSRILSSRDNIADNVCALQLAMMRLRVMLIECYAQTIDILLYIMIILFVQFWPRPNSTTLQSS